MPGSGCRPSLLSDSRARTVAGLLTVALAAAACTTAPPPDEVATPRPGPTPSPPSTLRIGISPLGSLDPAQLETAQDVLVASQVFDGLIQTDPLSGEVLPAVAERWEIDAGGRRLVFRLGASTFHDGRPVRAQDFVFAWRRLVDPDRTFPFSFLLEDVQGFARHRVTFGARPFDGVRAVDDRTLEVRLGEPNGGFLPLLAHPALSPVPPNADSVEFATRPIGNGPYRVAEDLTPDAPIRLEAMEGIAVGVRSVELRPFEEPEAGWPEFVAGELDLAEIPFALVDQVAPVEGDAPGVRPVGRLLYCGFNLSERRFPRALRKAVSVGVDRAALIRRVYGGTAQPADGIVPPTFPGHRSAVCGEDCLFDPDRARELVDEVPERQRSFRLDFPLTQVGEELASALAGQLGEIGLDVTPRGHDEAAYSQLLRQGRQGAFCLVWVADAPTPQRFVEPLVASGSPDNQTNVQDDALDTILADARAETDLLDRAELYTEAEQRAMELMPLVPLAWFRSRIAAQPHVAGLAIDPLGRFEIAALRIER